jgi:metal-responsive CopG/Arc/MetJ family transcriptional regulator
MTVDDELPETVTIEAELPGELLREIDAFAARHGYESPDTVVAAALARRSEG